jgi:alginate O-acetyltransferase complex protein AlgI
MRFWQHPILLPDTYLASLGRVGQFLAAHGVAFVNFSMVSTFGGIREIAPLAASLICVLVLPNTSELVIDRPATWRPDYAKPPAWRWRLDWRWAAFAAILLTLSLGSIGRPSEFLYFQF